VRERLKAREQQARRRWRDRCHGVGTISYLYLKIQARRNMT
jgi:hypothetical protein